MQRQRGEFTIAQEAFSLAKEEKRGHSFGREGGGGGTSKIIFIFKLMSNILG